MVSIPIPCTCTYIYYSVVYIRIRTGRLEAKIFQPPRALICSSTYILTPNTEQMAGTTSAPTEPRILRIQGKR